MEDLDRQCLILIGEKLKVRDLLNFCMSHPKIHYKLYKEDRIWINKLRKDFGFIFYGKSENKKAKKYYYIINEVYEDKMWGNGLLESAEKGYVDVAKYMIGKGADNFDQAMHWAAEYSQVETINLMIEYGTNEFFLHPAVMSGNIDIVKLMIEKGGKDFTNGIHCAASNYYSSKKVEYYDILIFLLLKNEKNYEDDLIWAIDKGYLEIVVYLIERNKNANSSIVLRRAIQSSNLDIVKYLIENGADIHAYSDLPLRLAAKYGNLDIIKFIIKYGEYTGMYAMNIVLQGASVNGHLEAARYAAEHGADISIENEKALRYAHKEGQFEVVKYLIQQGANSDYLKDIDYFL